MAISEKYGQSLVENLLTLLGHSDEHGKIVHAMLDTQLLEGNYRLIGERFANYWRQYREAPKLHAADLFDDIFSDTHDHRAGVIKRLLRQMVVLSEGINATYVLRQLQTFTRQQSLKRAVLDAANVLARPSENSIDEVEQILRDIGRAQAIGFDPGVRLDDLDRIEAYLKRESREFTSGVKMLDERSIVPARGRAMLLVGGKGVGKCLGLGTQVLKYDGTVVPVEALRVGDLLMGPDNYPRRVLSISRGEGPLYRITPRRGEPWVCNDAHIMTLVNSKTGLVSDVEAERWRSGSPQFYQFNLLFSPDSALDFPRRKTDPKLPPYFLGLWLGDGTKRDGNGLREVAISKPDIEVRQACEKVALKYGLTVHSYDDTHTLVCISGLKNRLLEQLRVFWRNQRVPPEYLTASKSYRRKLLAGLIDSDGYLRSNSSVEIIQKNQAIGEAAAFLARSLGIHAHWMAPKTVNGVKYSRLVLSGSGLSSIPTQLKRKTVWPHQTQKNANRTSFSVQPIGAGPYIGFTLDGDGRFLLGDFTVTHNSWFLVNVGRRNLDLRHKVLHVTLENSEDETLLRYWQSTYSIPKHELGEVSVSRLVTTRAGRTDREDEMVPVEFDLHSPLLRTELETRLEMMGPKVDNLRIKYFTTGQLTLSELAAYLDLLERVENFIPDMLIVDYPRLMKIDPRNPRFSIGQNMVGLRGLAHDRNMAVVVVDQLSREGNRARVARSTHIGEDWSQVLTADVVMIVSMTEKEQQFGLCRLYTQHARTEKDKFALLLVHNHTIGQFCIESYKLPDNYFEQVLQDDASEEAGEAEEET